jgi:hypothetical protein
LPDTTEHWGLYATADLKGRRIATGCITRENHDMKDTEEHDEEYDEEPSSRDNVQVQSVRLSEEVSIYSPVYEDSNKPKDFVRNDWIWFCKRDFENERDFTMIILSALN